MQDQLAGIEQVFKIIEDEQHAQRTQKGKQLRLWFDHPLHLTAHHTGNGVGQKRLLIDALQRDKIDAIRKDLADLCIAQPKEPHFICQPRLANPTRPHQCDQAATLVCQAAANPFKLLLATHDWHQWLG